MRLTLDLKGLKNLKVNLEDIGVESRNQLHDAVLDQAYDMSRRARELLYERSSAHNKRKYWSNPPVLYNAIDVFLESGIVYEKRGAGSKFREAKTGRFAKMVGTPEIVRTTVGINEEKISAGHPGKKDTDYPEYIEAGYTMRGGEEWPPGGYHYMEGAYTESAEKMKQVIPKIISVWLKKYVASLDKEGKLDIQKNQPTGI